MKFMVSSIVKLLQRLVIQLPTLNLMPQRLFKDGVYFTHYLKYAQWCLAEKICMKGSIGLKCR